MVNRLGDGTDDAVGDTVEVMKYQAVKLGRWRFSIDSTIVNVKKMVNRRCSPVNDVVSD